LHGQTHCLASGEVQRVSGAASGAAAADAPSHAGFAAGDGANGPAHRGAAAAVGAEGSHAHADALTRDIQATFRRLDAEIRGMDKGAASSEDAAVRLQIQRQLAQAPAGLTITPHQQCPLPLGARGPHPPFATIQAQEPVPAGGLGS
ncbi:Qa-SNARE protein, Tlg2/syntaxin16-family, partial [Haematococcus lacustris]